jgi:hypothetical protein
VLLVDVDVPVVVDTVVLEVSVVEEMVVPELPVEVNVKLCGVVLEVVEKDSPLQTY